MRTPIDHPLQCGECGGEMCPAHVFDTAHQTTFVCSLPKGHAGSHFDRQQIARWFDQAELHQSNARGAEQVGKKDGKTP